MHACGSRSVCIFHVMSRTGCTMGWKFWCVQGYLILAVHLCSLSEPGWIMQVNENSKLADSAAEKLIPLDKHVPAEPAPAAQQLQPHGAGTNGASSHDPSALGLQQADGSAEGEVGINGYSVHESAPRRQPADVSAQCMPGRPGCPSRRRLLFRCSSRQAGRVLLGRVL